MPRLVVIAGPANSGKTPLAMSLMADDPSLIFIGRDALRSMYGNRRDEADITEDMAALAIEVLAGGQSVCVCAWNLEPSDRHLWNRVADYAGVEMEWLDTRTPEAHALIPPLSGWEPIGFPET